MENEYMRKLLQDYVTTWTINLFKPAFFLDNMQH